LHIIGEPANLSVVQVKKFVEEAGLVLDRDVLITANRVENIADVLSTAVAGIIPSVGSEIICRVAEEFLLCGTPVAVSGVGSLDEVLKLPGFGVSWRETLEDQSASQIAHFIKSAYAETPETRKARATDAKKLFSYETMGIRFSEVLETF
jgi:hypothetical protein